MPKITSGGSGVEIKGTGHRYDGEYIASEVIHELGKLDGGYITEEHPHDIIAIRSGQVWRVGWQNENNQNVGMGWRISIDTGDGYHDQYGHLDHTSTLPFGTQVQAGDIIGRMAYPTIGQARYSC